MVVFIFCTLFLSSLSLVLSSPADYSLQLIEAPSYGPNAFTFDSNDALYASVEDGRIIKYDGRRGMFVNYAFASPMWHFAQCENNTKPERKPVCGRVYDFGFHYETQKLYIADGYFGLGVVGPEGGLATKLATSADGVDFKWLFSLAVDQKTGFVYLADVSTKYDERIINNGGCFEEINHGKAKLDAKWKKRLRKIKRQKC